MSYQGCLTHRYLNLEILCTHEMIKTVFLLFYQVMHLCFGINSNESKVSSFYDAVTIQRYSSITSQNLIGTRWWWTGNPCTNSVHAITSSEKILNNFWYFSGCRYDLIHAKIYFNLPFPVTWTSSNCALFWG